jgi:signal transduction histidine kinase
MTIRHRLMLVVIAAVALSFVALVAGFNVVFSDALTRDARALVRTRALAQLGLVQSVHGHLKLRVGEAPDRAAPDSNVWVFDGGRVVEYPRVEASLHAAARSLATGRSRYLEVPAKDYLLYALPIFADGHRTGTVVAATSLTPYEKTSNVALIGSVVFAAIVLLFVAFAAHWLLASAFRPVRRMTRQAADWGEHDLDRRFGAVGPNDELRELAGTLDGLLDRLAASLRREQRFSAELSHELRTPLARVLGESELALRRDREPAEYRAALELINRNAQQLTRIIEALIEAARHEASPSRATADASSVAHDAAAACVGSDVDLQISEPARPLRVGLDADLAARILQPVLENACRYGAHSVTVSIGRENGSINFAVEDDGPGVTDDERERIFEPGVRGAAAQTNGTRGSGLGLSLARRLARGVAGDVEAAGGTRFVIRLPAG